MIPASKSKCKFCTVIYQLSHFRLSLSFAISMCFVILFRDFHMPFEWHPQCHSSPFIVLCGGLHVWCSGTECDYSIAFSNSLNIILWVFRYEERMKVRNFIVDVNVEVYVVIEGACSLPAFYPAFSTLISRDSLSLSFSVIHLWMDWQKIRIRLHLIETRGVWRGWRGERHHPCDLSNISRRKVRTRILPISPFPYVLVCCYFSIFR